MLDTKIHRTGLRQMAEGVLGPHPRIMHAGAWPTAATEKDCRQTLMEGTGPFALPIFVKNV